MIESHAAKAATSPISFQDPSAQALPTDLRPMRWRGRNVFRIDTCPSTMDIAWELTARGNFPEMAWVLARNQTRGRGQLGRRWDASSGNLFATGHLPGQTRSTGALLPLALALTLADTLASHGLHPEIKWPNDLLLHGKKVAGILVEARGGTVMAGFGVNVKTAPPERTGAYGLAAGCLAEAGFPADAESLWQALAERLDRQLLTDLARPETLTSRLSAMLAFRGDWVVWEQAASKTALVRLLGLAPCGGLRVLSGREEHIVRSGRITPRIMI